MQCRTRYISEPHMTKIGFRFLFKIIQRIQLYNYLPGQACDFSLATSWWGLNLILQVTDFSWSLCSQTSLYLRCSSTLASFPQLYLKSLWTRCLQRLQNQGLLYVQFPKGPWSYEHLMLLLVWQGTELRLWSEWGMETAVNTHETSFPHLLLTSGVVCFLTVHRLVCQGLETIGLWGKYGIIRKKTLWFMLELFQNLMCSYCDALSRTWKYDSVSLPTHHLILKY